MPLQGMVSSRETIPDSKKATNENFVKELLDALAEIMDKKVHLENENMELRHKCLSQKQKIDAFKELALGEKAFLLGIIKRECCGACPGRQEFRKDEYPVRDEKVEQKISSITAEGGSVARESEAQSEKQVRTSIARSDAFSNAHSRHDDGDVHIDMKGSINTADRQNQTDQLVEIRNLQKLIQQYFEGAKYREETLLCIMQQIQQQMRSLHSRCDCMQNKLNEMQVEQKMARHKTRSKESTDANSIKSQEKPAQTETKSNKGACRCGGSMTQKEEEILSELFFQRF